jgi:nucleotide-binding universal stress UspA family protein
MSQSSDRTGILVGVDGSPESDAALRWGAQEAAMRRAPLALIHVATPVVASWQLGPMHGNGTSGSRSTPTMYSSRHARRLRPAPRRPS